MMYELLVVILLLVVYLTRVRTRGWGGVFPIAPHGRTWPLTLP
jgi:hypothetical protein